jgi:hypothetical protein
MIGYYIIGTKPSQVRLWVGVHSIAAGQEQIRSEELSLCEESKRLTRRVDF